MNNAAEQLVRYYLEGKSVAQPAIDEAVARLTRDLAGRRAGAAETRDMLVAAAMDMARGTHAEEPVMQAAALHLQIESARRAVEDAETLEKLSKTIHGRAAGPFADRVALRKAEELAASLR